MNVFLFFLKKLLLPALFALCILLLWQSLSLLGIIQSFVLPSPFNIVLRLIEDLGLLLPHALFTFTITLGGIGISLVVSFLLAMVMDAAATIKRIVYPCILICQLVPTIILAPLMIIVFGYGARTQLLMVVLMCFFPLLVTLSRGFAAISAEELNLLRTMGASKWQIFYWAKIPSALSELFSGLRLVVTYGISAAVISEWVGALRGLGITMLRSQKSFLIERVYAIIVLIIILSIAMYIGVIALETLCIPWKRNTWQRDPWKRNTWKRNKNGNLKTGTEGELL